MKNKKRLLAYVLLVVLLVAFPVTVLLNERVQKYFSGAEAAPLCKIQADVALVVDTSLTMNEALEGSIKPTSAIEAMDEFLSRMDLDARDGTYDRVAVVEFNSEAGTKVVQKLTSDRASLQSALNNLTTQQFTRIDSGLLAAKKELLEDRPERPKIIILLSDGGQDFEVGHPQKNGGELQAVQDASNQVKNAGIEIYCVFYGTQADRDKYQADTYMQVVVSPASNTHYYTADNSNSLVVKFPEISNLISACECNFH